MAPWALDAELKDGAARGQRDGSLAPNDGTSHTCKAAYNREFCSSAGDKRHRDDQDVAGSQP
jgi:hypothetical protein